MLEATLDTARTDSSASDQGGGPKLPTRKRRSISGLSGGLLAKGNVNPAQPGSPLISVIIPVRNGAATLQEAIRSVIDQQYPNVELIIIDGDSNDGTLDIIRQYDSQIHFWISEPDKGVYDAMNKGASFASGDWIYFLGSDDVLLNCLGMVAKWLKKPDEIYHGDIYSYKKNRITGGRFSARKLIRKNLPHQATFYPRSVFDTFEYDLRYAIVADYHLNVRCYHSGRFRFVYIPMLIAIYNDVDGLSSTHSDVAFSRDEMQFRRKYFARSVFIEYQLSRIIKKSGNLLKMITRKRGSGKLPYMGSGQP